MTDVEHKQPLTRDFSNTVVERAMRDTRFRMCLLEEAVKCFEQGEDEVGFGLINKVILAHHRLLENEEMAGDV